MNSDFKDLIRIFAEERVRFLVVGGYAVIHHAQPRYTKDLDLWVEPTQENARRLMRAFGKFGLPLLGLNESDFAQPGTQFSIGVSPREIDLLTTIPGLEFPPSWESGSCRKKMEFPSPTSPSQTSSPPKKTAGRAQDLADLEELQRSIRDHS